MIGEKNGYTERIPEEENAGREEGRARQGSILKEKRIVFYRYERAEAG